MTKREVQTAQAPESFPPAPAPEQKPAAKKPAAKKPASPKQGVLNAQQAVDALFIRSAGKSFRRGGCGFNQSGEYFSLDYFSDEQLAAIDAEPELLVKRVSLSPEEAEKAVIMGFDA